VCAAASTDGTMASRHDCRSHGSVTVQEPTTVSKQIKRQRDILVTIREVRNVGPAFGYRSWAQAMKQQQWENRYNRPGLFGQTVNPQSPQRRRARRRRRTGITRIF